MSYELPKAKHIAPTSFSARFGGSIVFMAIGLVILAVLFWINSQQQAFARIAKQVTGTVVELLVQLDPDNMKDSYAPKIEFLTSDQKTYVHSFSTYTYPSRYAVGDKVNLLYNPENPQEVVIAVDNSFSTNPFMIVFGVVGLIFFGLGAYQITANLVGQPMRQAA